MCVKVNLEPFHAAEREIEPVDLTDLLGFSCVDDRVTILEVIPQRDAAAHPHSFAFRRRNLVSDAFARHFPTRQKPHSFLSAQANSALLGFLSLSCGVRG